MSDIRLRHLYTDLESRIETLRTDRSQLEASRAIVEKALTDGRAYYSINTGFGALADKRISNDELAQLQHNLLMSHAVGLGPPVPRDITRLMLQLKDKVPPAT